MLFIKENKYIIFHYLISIILIITSLITTIESHNFILNYLILIIITIYSISTLFICKRKSYFEIAYFIFSSIISLIEEDHFVYSYFLTGVGLFVIIISLFTLTFKEKRLPYGVIHKKGFVLYKLISYLSLWIVLFLLTKVENYYLILGIAAALILFVVISFYITEWYIFNKEKKKVKMGKSTNIKVDLMYHEQTISMINLLYTEYYLVNGNFKEAIQCFDKVKDINFNERMDYNRLHLILNVLITNDYKSCIKLKEECDQYTKYYKSKKARDLVKKTYGEYKKYIDIYFNKANKYDLVLIKNNERYHNFFSALFYLKRNDKKKSQDYLTLLNELLPIEKHILNS